MTKVRFLFRLSTQEQNLRSMKSNFFCLSPASLIGLNVAKPRYILRHHAIYTLTHKSFLYSSFIISKHVHLALKQRTFIFLH